MPEFARWFTAAPGLGHRIGEISDHEITLGKVPGSEILGGKHPAGIPGILPCGLEIGIGRLPESADMHENAPMPLVTPHPTGPAAAASGPVPDGQPGGLLARSYLVGVLPGPDEPTTERCGR